MLPIHRTFRHCIAEALDKRNVRAPEFYRQHTFNAFLLDVSDLTDPREIALRALMELASTEKTLADQAIVIGVVLFLDATCPTDHKIAQIARLSSLWKLFPSDEHAYRDWIGRWYDD